MMGTMVMFAAACSDDDLKEEDVPQAVMALFRQMFPSTTAQWEKEANGQLKAEFYDNHREMEAWFTTSGTWVKTVKDLAVSELPQTVLDYVTANYKGMEIDDADWVETPQSNYYQVEIDRENRADIILTFTEDGTFIK